MDELQAKNCKHSTSVLTTDTPSLLFFPTLQRLAFCNGHHWLQFTAVRHGQGSLYHKTRKIRKPGLWPTEISMINGQLTKLANRKAKESCRLQHIPIKDKIPSHWWQGGSIWTGFGILNIPLVLGMYTYLLWKALLWSWLCCCFTWSTVGRPQFSFLPQEQIKGEVFYIKSCQDKD